MSTPTDASTAAARRTTIRDVAALAGVGTKTVSRVINNEPNVSTALRERVADAIARLDYHPDLNAGNLKRADRKTRTLGLVVGSVANPFSGAVFRGVEDVAMERGFAVIASSLDDDPGREELIARKMLARRVDALIATTVGGDHGVLLLEQRRGTPIVFVDRVPPAIDADVVLCDNREGAAQAAAQLVAHGHRRIAYLGDTASLWTARERKEGFVAALGASGIPSRDVTVVEDLRDEELAYQAVMRLFTDGRRPTALFTSQNLVTIGALRALRDLGLRRSVAHIGFDDVPLGDLLDPGVTVIAQHPYEIGRVAAETAFARLAGDAGPPRRVVVPTSFVPRGSGELHRQRETSPALIRPAR
jgi:LacI family transcriptional regulator